MKLSASAERRLVTSLLSQLGAAAGEADITAEVIAEADLRGYGSHGLLRFPMILKRIRAGTIRLQPSLSLARIRAGSGALDGGEGLGPPAAEKAMAAAVDWAREVGIAAVAVRRANHIGIAGYFAELAARQGLIGMAMTTTEPLVHPYGGSSRVLGTNPLAIAIPLGPPSSQPDPPAILLDMATSEASLGKIMMAGRSGSPIPEGWALDAAGRPTTDPEAALRGALSPFGGPKGYGLGLAIGLLAGALSSAAVGTQVQGTLTSGDPVTKGDLFVALDPAGFLPVEEFYSRAGELASQVKGSPPAEGFAEVLLPGERAHRTRRERLREGVPIAEGLWPELTGLCSELGLEMDVAPEP